MLQRLLRSLALADVPDKGGEEVGSFHVDRRERDLGREPMSIAVHCLDLDKLVDEGPLTGCEEVLEAARMVFTEFRRDDDFCHGPTDGLLSRPAEDRLRPRVPVGDPAGGIHGDDGVEG